MRLLRLKIYTPAAEAHSFEANQHGDLQYDEWFGGMVEDGAGRNSALDAERRGDEEIAKSAARRIAPSPTSSTEARS